MADRSGAVFLSYASQDAAAAQRIADALRAAGVEVWFDQNELVGGDAWDAKIRGQIAGCALFVPVISAATQARREGYFRIEWKLAAQRTHAMADGTPFLLPVVIDGTRDAEALVPAEFRAVQWTRLRPVGSGAASPAEGDLKALAAFGARVGKLLGAEEAQTGSEVGARLDRDREDGRGRAASLRKSVRARWTGWTIGMPITAALLAGTAWWWLAPGGRTTRADKHEPTTVTSALARPATTRDAGTDAAEWVQKARELVRNTARARPELEAADRFCRQASAVNELSAELWAVWSMADSWSVYFNFDNSAQRREGARTKAAKALGLDPRGFEPRLAQASFLVLANEHAGGLSAFAAQAEGLLRELRQERPKDPDTLLLFGLLQRNLDRRDEAREAFRELAKLPGYAAMAETELGWAEDSFGEVGAANAAADRAIAAGRYWNSLILKTEMALSWEADVARAQEMIAAMPASVLLEDAGIFEAMQLAWVRGDAAAMLGVVAGVSREWMQSNFFEGPPMYFAGMAHRLAGRDDAARQSWIRALQAVERRLAAAADQPEALIWKVRLQALLGDVKAARETFRLFQQVTPRLVMRGERPHERAGDYWLLEQPEAALTHLEGCVHRNQVTWALLKTAPMLDGMRSDPRFANLLERARLNPRLAPASAREGPARAAVSADGKSVAVLAFKNLSDDRDTEYFSDGVSEELGNVLGRVPGLRVAASTSAFSFKGKAVPVAEIARQLGVSYLVEGSVRKMGTTLRINAKLVQASDGFPVWSSGNLEREVKNIFALQDEIAGLIAQALALKLNVRSGASAQVNPEAYRLYLEGRAAWRLRTPAGEAKAEALLQQALALDPDFARGHVGLADVWVVRAQRENSAGQLRRRNRPLMERALASAQRAVQADSGLPEVHTVLGTIQWMDWKLDDAVRSHRIAVRLNPNDASAQQRLGRALLTAGDMDEALGALQRAHELDPLFARIADNYSLALIAARRFDAAVTMADRALALQPELRQALSYKVVALSELGRRNEVMASAREFLDEDRPIEQDSTPAMVAYGLARVNATAEAERLLARLPEEKRQAPVAAALLAMGKRQEALSVLRAGNSNVTVSDVLLWWPVFDTVRESPEFKEIISEMGLTEAHARAQAWRAANPPEKPAAK